VREYSQSVYGIPPEQVVGTAGATTYSYGDAALDAGAQALRVFFSDDELRSNDERVIARCVWEAMIAEALRVPASEPLKPQHP
jgi:hypothetical protein